MSLQPQPAPSAPEEHLQALWAQVREFLRATLNTATYNLMFDRARAIRLDGDHITLAVETEFARGWVMQRYQPVLKDALFEVLGTDIGVDVLVAPSGPVDEETPPPVPAPLPPQPEAGRVHGRLQERFTFENFVTGPSNRFANAAALAVAEAPANAYNPFFIYGGVGLGKTHLLQAIGHFVARNNPELQVRYVSAETFTSDFINALRDGGIRAFKDRYRSADVLLIDDIQSLEGKEQTQEEFFHTFNALYEAGKQVVISSDRPPKAIATLEERLRSRFEMGLMTDVQPPDLETRIAILRKKVQQGGYLIPDPEVLPFIAARLQDNVRELEGALTRVVAHATHAGGGEITVDLARQVLQDYLPAGGCTITVDMVQQEVCRHYGVSLDELVGEKREKRVVVPRQVAMYLARELTQSSLPTLGRAFGDRDHTTVMYAVNKVGRQMADEGEVFAAVQNLTHRLKTQV
ncbi:MAG TPA: chromosomal replication initiator protein DnaA [Miltoncostaeaceae bacterium]|nr:chromosomal replication initiator protein DnaA [Miltoncostaeaceae bacterium]